MKWSPRTGQKNKCRQNNLFQRHLFNSSLKAVTLLLCFASLGAFLHGDISRRLRTMTLATVFPRSLSSEIGRIATDITVKIIGSEFLGSGFIIHQQHYTYTVITNQHVLRAGERPYTIQTPDGKIHQAEVIEDLASTEYDLAILQFQAPEAAYATAAIGNSSDLTVGEPIFAAGFPNSEPNKVAPLSTDNTLTKFALKQGRIAIFLDKALEEGYQIGYTNDVKKGMSGGPLLNSRGEVVGINGKHAYPLWEAPDFFQDGSQPCPPLQKLITRSSLAIPIEKSINLTPQLSSLQPKIYSQKILDTNWSEIPIEAENPRNLNKLISQMQEEAEATKNCQELPN